MMIGQVIIPLNHLLFSEVPPSAKSRMGNYTALRDCLKRSMSEAAEHEMGHSGIDESLADTR